MASDPVLATVPPSPAVKGHKNLLPDPLQQQGLDNRGKKTTVMTIGSQPIDTPVQHFLHQEEIEFKSTLKELDRQLSLCLPSNQRADISFKSSATPVRTIFELPVPVESAGAHVNYRFATDEYDISFGVFFQGVDGKVETVLATNRVESQYEPISGDITVHRPGTVILLWDNTYSWFTTKMLSYTVNLRNPSSAIADEERTARAVRVLKTASAELTEARAKETVVKQNCDRLCEDVSSLEWEIAELQAQLDEKRKELRTTLEDKAVVERTLGLRQSHVVPLSLRCLTLETLLSIAQFTSSKDQLYLVSHTWRQLYREAKGLNRRASGLPVSEVE